MTITIDTIRCGLDDRYWTYRIFINGIRTPRTSSIYRMYDTEVTAMRNGARRLPVELRKWERMKVKP